jgi:hypothetical protein
MVKVKKFPLEKAQSVEDRASFFFKFADHRGYGPYM